MKNTISYFKTNFQHHYLHNIRSKHTGLICFQNDIWMWKSYIFSGSGKK